ncbi:MAG: DUF4476 domain-containing protein [Bacteroidota bacterium]
MKTTIICFILLSVSLYMSAQNSSISIFTSLPEAKFIARINGVTQNENYETSINIKGLSTNTYKLFIEFERQDVRSIDELIEVNPNMEYTIEISEKSDARQKTAKFGKNISRDLTFRDRDTSSLLDIYQLNVISMNPIRKNNPDSYSTGTSSSTNIETSDNKTNVNTTSNVDTKSNVNTGANYSTTTTTTTTGNPGSSANMNVNTGGTNVSLSISGNTTGTYQESYTTTTTTTGTTSASGHYIMPGYSGPVGCPWPMNPGDFSAAKATIASKDFEDSKLTIAKQITNSNCLFTDQVREIMVLFDFEDTKLEFAKYAYHKTYDVGNYFKVNDAFEFESSIDELNNYINQNR